MHALIAVALLTAAPVERLTHRQLYAERAELEENLPSVGGAVGLITFGTPLLVAGLALAVTGGSYRHTPSGGFIDLDFTGFYQTLLTTGIVFALAGAVLDVIGFPLLFTRVRERQASQERLDQLDARIGAFERGETRPPPPSSLLPATL